MCILTPELYNTHMIVNIIKYLSLIKRAFIKAITFRTEVFLWFILDLTPLLVLLLAWSSIYAGQSELGGYSFSKIIQYYFLTTLINLSTEAHFEPTRVEEIRLGKIDFYLIRPISYLAEIWCGFVGSKAYYILTSGTITVLAYAILTKVMTLPSFALQPIVIIQFVLLLLIGASISFLIALLIVLAGFWLDNAEGLQHFRWITVTMLSGWMLPLSLMPAWLRHWSELLPFKYLYAVPIGLLQGTTQLHWQDWLYVGGCVVFLWLSVQLIWKRAQLKHSSYGG